jgi:LacI family transcriptional regulator, galactose operon repressor
MTVDSTPVPPSRVLLMDVARLAGVSRTTASFVLSGRTDMGISVGAAARVRQAARDLGYRPSLLARSLRTNASHTIGLLSDGLGGELFAGDLIRGTQAAAVLHDKMIFVGDTGGDLLVEARLVNNMLDRGAGAFIFASQRLRRVRLSTVLHEQHVVLVNCTATPSALPAVVPDERGAGRSAMTALIERGHRDGILVVSRPGSGAAAGLRLRGINDVLREDGARIGATVLTVRQPDQVVTAVGAAFRATTPPTALVCLTDGIAMGAYQAARDGGISVPGDVSVVSFGDPHLAHLLDPQLTTVTIPYRELARQAVEMLLSADRPFVARGVPMPLSERSSVARARYERASGRELSSA